MRAIRLNAKPGKEFERIRGNRMPLAVEDMDAVLGSHDAEVGVAHLGCQCIDIPGRGRERLAVVNLQQPRMVTPRQRAVVLRRKQNAAGNIVLLDRSQRVRADMNGKHVPDLKFRAEPGQNGGDAGTVGIGQFGEIAGAHQQLDLGPAAARLDEAPE